MGGNKAARRAAEVKDGYRIIDSEAIPLIRDKTELITPELAKEMLKRNKKNRPINWRKVEQYADMMDSGDWKVHSQGIVLDNHDNILTGQKRLWAVIYSNTAVHMRISRGCPEETAKYLDRGTPQSSRDLATRETGRKHSPTEASIARGVCVLRGILKPSNNDLAEVMAEKASWMEEILKQTKGNKKTKPLLMILASVCQDAKNHAEVEYLSIRALQLADKLVEKLLPEEAARCWNKGAAFTLAMQRAQEIVMEAQQEAP